MRLAAALTQPLKGYETHPMVREGIMGTAADGTPSGKNIARVVTA